MKTAGVLVVCAVAVGCHRRDERVSDRAGSATIDHPASATIDHTASAAIDPAEARARAAFPKGAPVGIPEDPEGLIVVNHERVDLAGLGSQRSLAVLVDAWGPPTVDLERDDGHRTKGWPSPTGRCIRLDGNRVELVDCDPPGSDALPDESQVYAAEEARVRAAFPIHAPLAVPADPHALSVRGNGAVVLPAMPSRQLFLALEDAFGDSALESSMEGAHHVTIWKREGSCAVLDQCPDPKQADQRCWALLWFVSCGDPQALTSDPRFGRGP